MRFGATTYPHSQTCLTNAMAVRKLRGNAIGKLMLLTGHRLQLMACVFCCISTFR